MKQIDQEILRELQIASFGPYALGLRLSRSPQAIKHALSRLERDGLVQMTDYTTDRWTVVPGASRLSPDCQVH